MRIATVLFVMPTSGLVPDEGLYEATTDGLSRRVDPVMLGTELGYGPDFVSMTWLLTVPTSALAGVGVPTLTALRIVSSLFSLLSAILFITTIALVRTRATKLTPDISIGGERGFSVLSGPGLATLAFLFMPSHLAWGTLALRDSSSEFAALSTATGVALLLITRSRSGKVAGFFLVVFGLTGLEGSRSYLVALLCLAILSIAVWWPRGGRPTVAISLFAAVIGGLLLGSRIGPTVLQVITDAPPAVTSEATIPPGETSIPPGETSIPPGETSIPPGETATGGNVLQEQVLSRVDSRVSVFSVSRQAMMAGADSAYSYNYCVGTEADASTAICELIYLPLGVARFLGLPLFTPWNEDASSWRSLGGVENMAWLALLVGALLTLVLRRSVNTRLTTMIVVYTLLFVVAYALVSGNEGTAFRHKSQMLWAISLIIAFGYGWRTWVPRFGTKVEPPLARDLDITTKDGN